MTTRTAYDALGRTTVATDALGGTTSSTFNGLSQTVVVTDSTGRATRSGYDGTGTPRWTLQPEGASPEGFGFTGEWQDGAAGLVHLRARWYQPGQGTFTSRDLAVALFEIAKLEIQGVNRDQQFAHRDRQREDQQDQADAEAHSRTRWATAR